jgi:hypothetical protein
MMVRSISELVVLPARTRDSWSTEATAHAAHVKATSRTIRIGLILACSLLRHVGHASPGVRKTGCVLPPPVDDILARLLLALGRGRIADGLGVVQCPPPSGDRVIAQVAPVVGRSGERSC